jgi:hypothetical protein
VQDNILLLFLRYIPIFLSASIAISMKNSAPSECVLDRAMDTVMAQLYAYTKPHYLHMGGVLNMDLLDTFNTFLKGFETKDEEKRDELKVREEEAALSVERAAYRRETARREADYAEQEAIRKNQQRFYEDRIRHQRHENEIQRLQLESETTALKERLSQVGLKVQVALEEVEAKKKLIAAVSELRRIEYEEMVLEKMYSLSPDEAVYFIESERRRAAAIAGFGEANLCHDEGQLQRDWVQQQRRSISTSTSPPSSYLTLPSTNQERKPKQKEKEKHSASSVASLRDGDIERIVRKALRRFSQIPEEQRQVAYEKWEQELSHRYEPLVVDEILELAVEMERKMNSKRGNQ